MEIILEKITYTFAKVYKNKIAFRYRDENRQNHDILINDYQPRLYVETDENTGIYTYLGKNAKEKVFDSIYDCKQWIKSLKDTPIRIHGNYNLAQQFILDAYEGNPVNSGANDVRIMYLDIETYSPDGFPKPEEAKWPINAITIYDSFTKKYHVAALCDYDVNLDETNKGLDITFQRFDDELDLGRWIIRMFEEIRPDIFTGFNSHGFDLPYIVNRLENILGIEAVSRLSPFNVIQKREVIDKSFFQPRKITEIEIFGITHLDYKQVYEKHGYTTLDSFSLNSIAEHELGESKLSYEEEGSLHNLYVVNPQKFVEYNIRDVKLMVDIENKRKLFDKIIAITFLSKSNFEDAMGTKRLWENRISSTLYTTDTVPIYDTSSAGEHRDLVGAFVREPKIGLNGWGTVIDAASLYPNLIIQYGMDLKSHIPYWKLPQELRDLKDNYTLDDILNKRIDLTVLKKYDVAMTANFEFFDRKIHGIIPQECKFLYNERKSVKKISQKHFDNANNFIVNNLPLTDEYYRELLLGDQEDTMQHGLKIMLNSLYGAITMKYFNYFKFEIGEAITTTGQLANKWVGNAINKFLRESVFENDPKYAKYDFITYGDTDSVIVSLQEVVDLFGYTAKSDREINDFLMEFIKDVLNPVIAVANKEMAEYTNAYENRMDWEYEILFSRALFVAKKKYVMKLMNKDGMDCVDHPKWKIMGMESVKKAAYPKWATPLLEQAYKTIINEDENTLQSFVKECENKFLSLDENDIAIPTGVNGLEKYQVSNDDIYGKGTPKHVKAALIHNHLLIKKNIKHVTEIKSGDKIKYLELRKGNPIGQPVIGFGSYLPKEFELSKWIDRQELFNKGFLTPLEKALNPIGWSHTKINNVSNFFEIE
jgi:DNA polymerase